MQRTGYCGSFRKSDIDKTVCVCGWVQTKRDMGGVIFIDLRDREGVLQVVFNLQNLQAADFAAAEGLKNETVVRICGKITLRDEETYNPAIATGEVELRAEKLEVLSEAAPLPFAIDSALGVREELRLKYRFLDIRRPAMQDTLRFRHKLFRVTRDYLDHDGFIEVETPMLTKSTPEGARDYLVPSRVHPGKFYALPQSPQIFKQLLMVGGVDKYYQMARCFRDEDLRADRQPEFTQVDMELSFVDQEDILNHLENLFSYITEKTIGYKIKRPFTRLTWQQAMDVYGSDKPDLRFGLPICDITDIAENCGFSVFRSVVSAGGVVRAINIPGGNSLTRTAIEDLTKKAQGYGAKGMAWIALRPDGEIYSILTKYFSDSEIAAIFERCGTKPGDFLLFCADKLSTVRRTLGGLRLDIAEMFDLRRGCEKYAFLIVTNFPQFEWSEEENRFLAMHHPFTMPYEEDIQYLISDPGRVRAQAYDVVLNGIELGSGSIRIHRRDVQQKMFEALGFSPEETEERFGFMVNAFKYGTPPHGGFAFGVDRLVMMLLDLPSLRDVIAFPKVKDASCLMTDAPNVVDPEQLEILGIGITGDNENEKQTETHAKKAAVNINVDNVAELSKLELNDEQKAKMKKDLADIIGFANQLSEIDTDGVEPTAHVLPVENRLRADVVENSFERSEIIKNAPCAKNGYLFVPKTFE